MRTQREMKGQRSDMNLRAVEQEHEWKRQSTSKACGKQSSCCSNRLQSAKLLRQKPITSTEEEGNRNKGNEEAFSSDQSAIAVTEGEEIEPKTVKDAECETIEFDYMFQTSRYQAPNKEFF